MGQIALGKSDTGLCTPNSGTSKAHTEAMDAHIGSARRV